MAKIEAKKYIRVIGIPTGNSEAKTYDYFIVGKGMEELSTEMNANVETTQDILGNNETKIASYAPSSTVSPYSADDEEELFDYLQGIIDEQKTLDNLLVQVLDVKLYEEASTGAYPAVMQEGIVEITSYTRSATAGYTIDFNLHLKGNPVKGSFNPTAKTWTPDMA